MGCDIDHELMIATFHRYAERKGGRGLSQPGRDRPPTSIRPVASEKVRCLGMLVAIENMQPLAPRGREKLASSGFPDPCLANEQGGFAVLEAPLQEVVSATNRNPSVSRWSWKTQT